MRIRATVLRVIASSLDLPPPVPVGAGPAPSPRSTVDTRRFLSWLARDTSPLGRRTSAAASLAAVGVGAADLADLRLTDLTSDPSPDRGAGRPGAPRLVLHRSWVRPGPGTATEPQRLPLPGWAADAVRSWLQVRPQVAVSDRVPQLLLTCHPSHTPHGVYAAGLPVSARALHRAHQKAVRAYYPVLRERYGPDLQIVGQLRLGALTADVAGPR